jgi:hypothetical protein
MGSCAGSTFFAPVFAEGWCDALRSLSFMNKSPLQRKAALRIPIIPTPLSLVYESATRRCPENHRYAVDNMWTSASIDALLPGLHKIARTLPPPPSHMLWMNWSPPPAQDRPDMAFSMEDRTCISCYGGWKDSVDDDRYGTWAEDRMRELQHLASGCHLADENLGRRPARFISDLGALKHA